MTAVASALEFSVLDGVAELEQIRRRWSGLCGRCEWATPFQTPEWVLPFCHAFCREGVQAVAVWNGTELAGLAPLSIRSDENGAGRRAALLGTGLSDYLDILACPATGGAAASLLLDHLSDYADVETCDFQRLAGDGPLVRELARSGRDAELVAEEPCPVLALPEGRTSLADCIPNDLAKKLAYYRRRLARTGSANYAPATDSNLDELFASLVRLHTQRWNGRGTSGVLADERVQRFHGSVTRRMLEAGTLRMYGLRLDGQWIAVYYGFACNGRSYYYLSGFDLAAGTLSPGMLIVAHAIEAAQEEGCTAFDFLRGREPYKYAWGARDHDVYRWRFSPHEQAAT